MSIEWLALGILGTWRLTSLVASEDGPWGAFARLRRVAGDRWGAGLLDCFCCLSLWAAAPIALLLATAWRERVLLWLALSAGAILLERLIPALSVRVPTLHNTRIASVPNADAFPTTDADEMEIDDIVLRQHAATVSGRREPARSR